MVYIQVYTLNSCKKLESSQHQQYNPQSILDYTNYNIESKEFNNLNLSHSKIGDMI